MKDQFDYNKGGDHKKKMEIYHDFSFGDPLPSRIAIFCPLGRGTPRFDFGPVCVGGRPAIAIRAFGRSKNVFFDTLTVIFWHRS